MRLPLFRPSFPSSPCSPFLSLLLPVLLLLFSPLFPCHSSPVSERTINVALSATWPTPPPLIEASEHLASVDPAHYWTFLDLLSSSPSPPPTPLTDAAQHQLALSLASHALGPGSMEVLSAILALHTHSVKAHLYHTLLADTQLTRPSHVVGGCEVVVQWGGGLYCGVDGVELEGASEEVVYDFDHVLPSGGSVNRTVVVWADLASLHQTRAHSQLSRVVRRATHRTGQAEGENDSPLTHCVCACAACGRYRRRKSS